MTTSVSNSSTNDTSMHIEADEKHDTAIHHPVKDKSSQDAAISEEQHLPLQASRAVAPLVPANESMFGRVDVSPVRRTLIFLGLCLGLFLSLMDTSIMATAIYTIALDFDSLAKAFWAILSYQLAYLGFAVVFARFSDFTGRRNAVLFAYFLFVGFSLACGWSHDINQLIAFRTIQGIGGAGLYSLAVILMVEASTPKLLPFTSSLIGATIAISGVLGPILGGVLTQYASWRWIFWINGPIGATAIFAFALGFPYRTPSSYISSRRKISEFDWLGAVLILAASVLVVFGLQEAGTGSHTWSSPLVLGTLISGCGCWVILFAWEYYVHLHHRTTLASMFPFSIILNRPLIFGILSTMLTGFSYFYVIISLPLRFQIVNLRSPASAGVQLLPLLCATGLGGTVGGAVSTKKNRIWETFVVANALVLLGVGLFSTLGDSVSIEAKAYGFQVIVGFGVGCTFSAISVMTSISTDKGTHSVAQGIAAQIRIFGGSIGVAASNAIFNATCARRLRGILTPEQISGLQTNTRMVAELSDAARDAVRLAYAESFRTGSRVCCIVAGVCVLAALGTWQRSPPAVQKDRFEQTQPPPQLERESAVDIKV